MYKEKAIPLVTVDANGKYTLQDQAVEFLRSLQGPIGVISVAGLYRTGKSYLLNRMLLNRSNGFGVGSTINACTKGLWVWGTPLKGQSSEGEPINIIVIDTQGIGAVDEDSTHDTKIFTLAILASSCFIYNSSGSIDEGAIQNLSLVVNLTKHIHLKTQSKQEEDPDDFANFFPSFFWVVRDFSLQLVDTNGHSITSQQYLENALAVQKGTSMDLEEKNRIRKLLSTFFRERQCFTLVRPHADQDKLRELDNISFDQLRPQFVEQVMTFRKRLLGRMKPKVLNQKKLSGQMYSSLMKNYVAAINEGAVPNIENAWNYMCREQCEKVSAEAYQIFENKIKENLSQKWPCSEEDFISATKGAKNAAYDLFKKKAFGDNIQQYFEQLKKRVKAKVNTFRVQNQKECAASMHSFIVKQFSQIQRKLKLQQFKTYAEFQKQLGDFYNELIEKGPKLVNKKIICLEFMRKILPQGAGFFFKVHENEYEKLKTISSQKEKTTQKQIKDMKEQMTRDKTSATEKLYTVDKEKMQMTLKIQKLQQQVQLLSKDKTNESQKLNSALQLKSSELETIKKTLQSKLQDINSKNDQMNSKLVTSEKQWDKDKAIYQQKVKLLTQQVQDLQKKQKLFDSTINSSKSHFEFELKDATLKFERRISELSLELNDYKDKSTEGSEELRTLKEQYENCKDKFDKKEKKYKDDLSQKIKQIQRMKHETQLQKNKIESDYLNDKDQLSKDFRQMTDNYKQQETSIKNLNEQMKSQKNSYDKEIAIITQKLGFAEQSLRDTKQQLAQAKRNHEATIAAMEETNGKLIDENENARIIELKNSHLNAIKQLQQDNELAKRKLQFDVETLNKAKNDLELRITLLDSTLAKQRQQNLEVKKVLDEKLDKLTSELNLLETTKNGRIKQQQYFFEGKMKQLERQLEQLRDKSSYEQRESHTKSQEAITQLKNYYQMERQKLEGKIGIEKEKAEKKLRKAVEELEQKHKQEITTLEQEHDEIKDQLINENSVLKSALQNIEHERDIKARHIENIERNYSELKQTFSRRQIDMNTKYETLFQTSKTEKQSQYEKIELLQNENNSKEKLIMTLNHSKDQLETTLQKKQALVEEQKRQLTDLRTNYEKTSEDLKKRYQQLSNEYLQKKIQYEKTIALKTQQSQYNARRAKDSERQLESSNANFDERMKIIKEQSNLQVNALKEKEESIKITLESKYEKLKKSSRQTEGNLQKTIIQLEKQKAIDTEKYLGLDEKYRELQQKRARQFEDLNTQLTSLRQSFNVDKKTLQSDIDRYKIIITELENGKSQAISTYEKDRILWENKLNFLEQQKDQNRIQYTEKINKLETALDSHQRNRLNQKSSAESNYNQYVSKMQKKYISQIHELNEQKTKRTMEHQTTIKELEMTVKNMKEKYELDIHSKNGNVQNVEKRLLEYQQNEKKLQSQVDQLRKDKDQKNIQYQKTIDTEKQNSKNKMKQVQQRLRKVENDKRNLFFEHEKEKAKWNYEEQHRKQKIQTLTEQVQKNVGQIEKLQRQNERLKAEKKSSKLSNHPSFINKYSNYGDKSANLNKSALGGVTDTTFVLNTSDIPSQDRENDPTFKTINL